MGLQTTNVSDVESIDRVSCRRQARLCVLIHNPSDFLHVQTSPDGADQNVVGALRLKGALNRAALQDALRLVMCRHDALRARFVHAADGAWQQVTLTACLMTALHAQCLHARICCICESSLYLAGAQWHMGFECSQLKP